MNLRLLALLALFVTVFASCNKDDDDTPAVTYIPNTANSTWTYDTTMYLPIAASGSYTLTATSRDTTVGTRNYRVVSSTSGGNSYYAQSGTDYYQFSTVPGVNTQKVELLYLKDVAEGTSWTENYSITYSGFPVTVPATYQVVKKGYDTTIGTNTFKDVIRVKTTLGAISIIGTPTTDINYVYARGVGRIYSRVKVVFAALGVNIDTEAKLRTYTIR